MIKTLGLVQRARKLTIGTDITITHLRANKLFLILLAHDASDLTKKKIHDKAKTYQCQVLETLSSNELSHAIGKSEIKVIGITDRGFSQLIIDQQRK